MTTTQIPLTGDAVELFRTMLRATWIGLVSDPDTPPMMGATMEMVDGEAVITTDVLVGPRGLKGDDAPIVKLHWPAPATAMDLPTNWDESYENHGFLIGGLVHVWDGNEWQAAQAGPQGQVGPTPNITITAETIPLNERTPESEDEVIPSGTSLNKHFHFRLLSPQGEQGEMGDVEDLTNYDGTGGKSPGKVLTILNTGKWGPSDFAAKQPRMYTIPEQAFSNFSGLAQRQTILAYTIEAQDYDWVPDVSGHLRAFGIELDTDPLTIGCEVRLGHPLSGQLIGRGFGNITGWTIIQPHFSSAGAPTVAVAPDNGVAMTPAGQAATIYVNLYNDGLIGAYIFNRAGAQLRLITNPQSSAA